MIMSVHATLLKICPVQAQNNGNSWKYKLLNLYDQGVYEKSTCLSSPIFVTDSFAELSFTAYTLLVAFP